MSGAEEELLEVELDMLVEECERLVSKLAGDGLSEEPAEEEPVHSLAEKRRLEQEFVDLCLAVERQSKELDELKELTDKAKKDADYYNRSIREKESLVANLTRRN